MNADYDLAPRWIKLDNAAKIYPCARSRAWTPMFRLSMTLSEDVDMAALEAAQSRTLRRFPTFTYRLRSGMFWYYLERMDSAPNIQKDVGNPMVRMNFRENRDFMFRLRCYGKRVAVEIFHVLTDGTGGMCFLKTLIAEYLTIKYGVSIPREGDILDCSDDPKPEEMEDSFLTYARKATRSRSEERAYRLRGTPAEKHFVQIITGVCDVNDVRRAAGEYAASVNTFLVSALLYSIQVLQQKEQRPSLRRLPIKVSVPINLRRFYDTRTLRNFSSYVNLGVQSVYGAYSFDEIITQVKHGAGLEINEKPLNARFSQNVKDERQWLMRAVPLFIKKPVLKLFFIFQGDRYYSATLSNLGVVTLPEEMKKYVTRVDFLLGPPYRNPVNCACASYDGQMCLSFTRNIKEPAIERGFFTFLVEHGVPVTIESNQR